MSDFLNSIRYVEDEDRKKLLRIQRKLEENINKENAYELTKDLSKAQKMKLLNLYQEQNDKLNQNINNYKDKILKIRGNMNN